MAIKTYQKNSKDQIAKNFKAYEFACHGSDCCSTTKIDEKLVAYIQMIRDHFDKPVYVNSAYRCAKHNKKVGGSSSSCHVKGTAADIRVKDVPPTEVAKYAESIGILGIGLYETAVDGYFVHIDTRTKKFFWYGQKQAKRTTFGGAANEVEYTLKQFVEDVQRACGAKVDGVAGPETLSKTVTVSWIKNRKHAVVEPIQKRLKVMGYNDVGEADGTAGSKFMKAVKQLQGDIGCKKDGEVTAEKTTWKKLLGMI